jgi:hypothetical protein
LALVAHTLLVGEHSVCGPHCADRRPLRVVNLAPPGRLSPLRSSTLLCAGTGAVSCFTAVQPCGVRLGYAGRRRRLLEQRQVPDRDHSAHSLPRLSTTKRSRPYLARFVQLDESSQRCAGGQPSKRASPRPRGNARL